MKTGEFAVIDNNGFVETGIKNQTKALKVVKDLKKSGKFVSGGNLTIVRVVASFDNFIDNRFQCIQVILSGLIAISISGF